MQNKICEKCVPIHESIYYFKMANDILMMAQEWIRVIDYRHSISYAFKTTLKQEECNGSKYREDL